MNDSHQVLPRSDQQILKCECVDEEMSRRKTKALVRTPLNKNRPTVYRSSNEMIREVTVDEVKIFHFYLAFQFNSL